MFLRVYLLALATFVSGVAENICVGILPAIAYSMRVSLGAAGQLITLFSITFALSAPILLVCTARAPRKLLLLAAMVVFCAGNLLAGLSESYALLVLSRLVTGAACALICLLASTLAAELVPPGHEGRAIGIVFMGICGSLVLGVPIGVYLAEIAGWRAPFFVLAALAGVATVLLAYALPVLPPRKAAIPLSQYARHIGSLKLMSGQAVSVLMIGGHFVVFAYLTPYLQQHLKLDGAAVGVMYLLFGIGGVTGGFLGGLASDWLGRTRALVLSPLIYCVVLAAIGTGVSAWWTFIPLMMLWGCMSWTISPIVQNYLMSVDRAGGDVSISLNISAMHLGVAFGAWLGGIIINAGGMAYIAIGGTGVAALAVVAACTTVRLPYSGASASAGVATTRF